MKFLKLAGRCLVWAIVTPVVFLLGCQSRLIYFPRPYEDDRLVDFEQRHGKRLDFTTSQRSQTAFYLPPLQQPASAPVFVWLVFGGNGALALDYADEPSLSDGRFGCLFVDYPGYGLCAGEPNPDTIRESAVAAAAELRRSLGWSEEEFRSHTGVFGHSIGCAAALLAAEELQLRCAVLCAPFTTMTDMARTRVGWPLCLLNRHRFDNVARLTELDARQARVRVFHGTQDELIPVGMSRALASRFPTMIRFTEIPEATHNDVVMEAGRPLSEAMLELSGPP